MARPTRQTKKHGQIFPSPMCTKQTEKNQLILNMTEHATNTSHTRSQLCIKIRQQNLNKSLTTQSDMEHQLDPDEYDMATIQEPYLNFNHNTQATNNWFTVYPKENYDKPNKTRSIILINKRILTNSWTHIDFASSDMMAFQKQTPAGYILCINMYNDAQNSEGVQKVTQYMSRKAHDQNP